MIEKFRALGHGRRRCWRCRRSRRSTASTWVRATGSSSITTLQEMPLWENGGYLVLRPEVFEHLAARTGDLIGDVCAPLAKEGRMMAYRHRGFWQPADTVKERTALEAAYQSGTRPWMLWDAPDRDPLQAAIAELSGRLDR